MSARRKDRRARCPRWILSRLMMTGRGSLTKAEAVLKATIAEKRSMLDEARALLSRFHAMIRERQRPDLDTWREAAARSLLASFASGLLKDKMAIAAGLTQPWSIGQTEGWITRLKLVKRQMFGRENLTCSKLG